MFPKCFYLLAVLTTIISFTFSNVTLYPDGTDLPLGSMTLKVRNLVPLAVDFPATNVSSSSDGLSFSLNSPLSASFTVQVFMLFVWIPSSLTLTLTGGANYVKNSAATCDAPSTIRDYCDLKAHVVVRGIFTNKQIADVAIDVCDQVEPMLITALTPRAQQSLPAPAAGATELVKLLYFRKFTFLSGLSQSLDLPCYKKFVAANAMEVSTGLALPLLFDFDTANPITSTTIDIAVSITNAIKKLLKISTYDNVTDATTVIEFEGGNVTMPSLKNIFNQIVTKEARAALKAYVPPGSALVYNVVVNDLQCRFFNTICSIPAENGIQVINSHFTGLGDLNGVLDNALGQAIDEAMTNATFKAVKLTSILSGGRYYLPLV